MKNISAILLLFLLASSTNSDPSDTMPVPIAHHGLASAIGILVVPSVMQHPNTNLKDARKIDFCIPS